jgi:hypothetical protein
VRSFLASALVALTLVGPAAAAGPAVDWSSTPVERGTVLPGQAPGGDAALRLVSRRGTGSTFELTEIADPPIRGDQYAIAGRVRYEDVQGSGYLEMWSAFADGGRYFTRTLAGSGPLARLQGTSGWREFSLPFYLQGHEPPTRLELNLVLPGRGTVFLGPLGLVQPEANAAWWSERTAGLLGAIFGSAIGLAGAAVGLLAARGRARRLVLLVLLAMIASGALLLGIGVAAFAAGEPSHVWYAPLLGGVIAIAVGIGVLTPLRRRYAEIELRRMRALDLAGPARR